MARCLVVQHAEPETPGTLAAALTRHGVTADVRRVFAGDELPEDLLGHDGLVVMGGPMSAHLDRGFPTRARELGLLRGALAAGRPTLGICLGAQLLALAAGGDVFRGEAGPEIGWGTVRLRAAAGEDALLSGLPRELTVLHWHGDTFRTGAQAVLLASSARYEVQAFRVGPAAWGLQFHVEVDEDQVRAFVAAFAEDAARAEDGAEGIVSRAPEALEALRRPAALIGDRFAALVAGARGD